MRAISRLLLCVHPVPYDAREAERYLDLWSEFLRAEARDERCALCLLTNRARGVDRLRAIAEELFGSRSIVDPSDESAETVRLMGEDLRRTLGGRGSHAGWIPYEIWTSNNARTWCEGLKRELAARGFGYDEGSLEVTAFGQQWQGCLTKYSLFMAAYLGLRRPAEQRPDLSPGAGFPLDATWKESHPLAHHVLLHLFETADGRPMAQLTDGLRPVWELPHRANVAIPPSEADLVSWSPNAYIQAGGEAANLADGVVMDVGDGCHGDFSTLIGRGTDFGRFRSALLGAHVEDVPRRAGVYHAIPYLVPARMSPERV